MGACALLVGCYGGPDDPGVFTTSAPCEDESFIPAGFWVSGDGEVSKLPNFWSPADGRAWLFSWRPPERTGRVISKIEVTIEPEASTAPSTPAALWFDRFSVTDGWTRLPGGANDDVHATTYNERHALILEGLDEPIDASAEDYRTVLHTPVGSGDAGLWVWSVPVVTLSCAP